MGRYKEASVGSRPDFFITGVIDASLKTTEKWLDSMEWLKSLATNGAMMSSEMRFKVYIGIGSAAEHLPGSRRMVSTTSSADTSMNVWSETPEHTLEKFGNGAPSVAAWILATFSEKN